MVDQGGTTARAELPGRAPDSSIPLDPDAVERAYLLHRARRRARFERHREKRMAGLRFWLVVLVLVSASLAVALLIAREVRQLFGI
jgi:hypothetical protein